jgi:hypothetical protein
MIALSSDCLLFRMSSGESIPFSAEMISIELVGESTERFDADFVRQAAHAVFHYFKLDLGRQTVSVGEFAEALEKVLQGLTPAAPEGSPVNESVTEAARGTEEGISESDLCRLACESGEGCELFFFPLLRAELRRQLSRSPRVLRFRGLRGCVKQLTGARRWNLRCRTLQDQIVGYVRECLSAEAQEASVSVVVR